MRFNLEWGGLTLRVWILAFTCRGLRGLVSRRIGTLVRVARSIIMRSTATAAWGTTAALLSLLGCQSWCLLNRMQGTAIQTHHCFHLLVDGLLGASNTVTRSNERNLALYFTRAR